eukprot:1462845-Ditylum_brightwellii.AAC.2
MQNGKRRFKVSKACGRSQLHSFSGKWGSVLHRPEMKWALKVWIFLSAVFLRCMCSGDSSNLVPFALMMHCIALLASLSNTYLPGTAVSRPHCPTLTSRPHLLTYT